MKAVYNRNTGLLAIALNDHSVVLYDCSTYGLIRRFTPAMGCVTTLCFNEDGRWLFIADDSKQLRIFDIPNSIRLFFYSTIDRLIDWIEFEKNILSMSVSYNGEFIATSHEDQIGISIWANNSYYQDIALEKIPSTPSKYNRKEFHS